MTRAQTQTTSIIEQLLLSFGDTRHDRVSRNLIDTRTHHPFHIVLSCDTGDVTLHNRWAQGLISRKRGQPLSERTI